MIRPNPCLRTRESFVKVYTPFFMLGCLMMATGILFAAAGAHMLSSEQAEGVWRSANQMQLIHGVGMIILSFLAASQHKILYRRMCAFSGVLMMVGLVLFSFHLYVKALGYSQLLPAGFAPVGGMSYALSWVVMLMAGWGLRASDQTIKEGVA